MNVAMWRHIIGPVLTLIKTATMKMASAISATLAMTIEAQYTPQITPKALWGLVPQIPNPETNQIDCMKMKDET